MIPLVIHVRYIGLYIYAFISIYRPLYICLYIYAFIYAFISDMYCRYVRYKGIVAVMIINRLLIQTALPATGERGCGILTV